MFRRCFQAGALLLLSACTPPAIDLGLPADGTSWIFALEERSGAKRILDVEAVEGQAAAQRFVSASPEVRVHALSYPVPLSALGLQSGPVPMGAPCARSCALVRPSAAFVLDTDGRAGAWQNAAPIAAPILDRLVPDRSPRCEPQCLSVTATSADLSAASRSAFFLPAVPEGADQSSFEAGILGLLEGSVWRIGGPGQAQRLCAAGSFKPRAGTWRQPYGSIWAISTTRELAWLRLDGLDPDQPCPFVSSAQLPSGSSIIAMASPPETDGSSFLTITETGTIARWSRNQLVILGAADLDENEARTEEAILVDRGDRAFAGAAGDDLVTIRGDQLSHQRRFALGIPRTKTEALLVWGDRTFLTTKGYNLFILDRDTFVPLDEGAARMASTWENCRGLGVMQGRIVATLNQGFLGEWSPETSYCPLRTPQAQDGGQRALTIQHRLVTVDSQSRTAAQHVVWFSADTPEACR
ncbi:MAG: hypothetical protein U1E65_29205 [Myxococcota bacterium]